MEYRVKWEIDIEASSPLDAAHKALQTQRDPDSTATVFEVTWKGSRPGQLVSEDIDLSLGDKTIVICEEDVPLVLEALELAFEAYEKNGLTNDASRAMEYIRVIQEA